MFHNSCVVVLVVQLVPCHGVVTAVILVVVAVRISVERGRVGVLVVGILVGGTRVAKWQIETKT